VRNEDTSSGLTGDAGRQELDFGVVILERQVEGPAKLEVAGDGSSADEDAFRRFFFLSLLDKVCSVLSRCSISASRLRFLLCFFSTYATIRTRLH
jgi:hypothetical protein